jgi:hypothetical protein
MKNITETPATLRAALKHAGLVACNYKASPNMFMVAEHKGELWLTNSYAIGRVDRFTPVFTASNLVPAIGRYVLNGSNLTVTDGDAPRLDLIMDRFTEGKPIEQLLFDAHVLVTIVGDYDCYVFGTTEAPIYVRRDLVDAYVPNAHHWTAQNDHKPVVAYAEDGTLLGAAMPYKAGR